MKPLVFVGSTKENKKYAKEIVAGLEDIAECRPWYDGVFSISEGSQSSLIQNIRESDFSVIILTGDDEGISRGENYFFPRDNLIFEAGISFGGISSDRTFLVPENIDKLKIPSDLLGFTLTKPIKKSAQNLEEAVSDALKQIKEKIEEEGRKPVFKGNISRKELAKISRKLISEASQTIVMFGRDLSWAKDYQSAIKKAIRRGVAVSIVAEAPSSKAATEASDLLKKAGATIYHLNKDLGLKCTIIDHGDQDLSRFIVMKKETRNVASKDKFTHKYEMHTARESKMLWNIMLNICNFTTNNQP